MWYIGNNLQQQQSMSKGGKDRDEDYEFKSDPKRKNYKKIKLQVKKSMIDDFYVQGVPISALTKKYHLSYSTIAHILKVYKEKNRIFESRRLKDEREIDESIEREVMDKGEIKQNTNENIKIEPSPVHAYPFYPIWLPLFY